MADYDYRNEDWADEACEGYLQVQLTGDLDGDDNPGVEHCRAYLMTEGLAISLAARTFDTVSEAKTWIDEQGCRLVGEQVDAR